MPWVVSIAAASGAGLGITGISQGMTSVEKLAHTTIGMQHALSVNVMIKKNIDKYNTSR